MDLLTFQAITARKYDKEEELKSLKAELVTLDQKITAELGPKQDKQDFGEDVKSSFKNNNTNIVAAEPLSKYSLSTISYSKGYSSLHIG